MSGDDSSGGGGGLPGKQQYTFVNNLAEKLGLSQGQILRAWVADPLPGHDEKIFINLKGKKTVAKTNLDVDRGDELIVQVRSTSPPIKLKLFEADSAQEELDDEALERYLQNQDFTASEQLLDVARFLMEQHLSLDTKTIEQTNEVWDELHDADGNPRDGRCRAMRFLMERDLPVTDELVRRLDQIPEQGASEQDWTAVASEYRSDTPLMEADWRELIRGIGIDMVRQIGKWPNSASNTLHARLLKQLEEDDDDVNRRLLAQLLGLALASIPPEEFWVIVPFYDNNRVRLLTLHLLKEKTENGWKWDVAGSATLGEIGSFDFELLITPDRSNGTITLEDAETARKADQRIDQLMKNLKAVGLDVNMEVDHGEVELLTPFSSRSKPELSGDPGKVDFTA